MTDTLFAQIVRRELPADLVYQDELVTAFRDVQPQAPTHIFIVPNKPVPTVADVTEEDEAALGRMIRVAARLAEEEGIDEAGYRLTLNCRAHAGQEVYHVHLHLLGGRPLGRMLSDPEWPHVCRSACPRDPTTQSSSPSIAFLAEGRPALPSQQPSRDE